MTATDLDTMRRAVLLDPADDLARLALADACEEAGQIERAEFVRVQVEAERLRRPGLRASMDDPGFRALAALNRAECRLLDQHWRTWAGCGDVFQEWHTHRFRVDVGRRPAVAFHRGFVESVALPLVAFMEHAGELFSRHPITAVTLTDRAPNDARVYGGIAKYQWLLWELGYMRTILIPGGSAMHYDIPVELFAEGRCGWLEFPTMDLAHAALSAGCVAYGRRLAGLPPLPVHPPADTGRHAR